MAKCANAFAALRCVGAKRVAVRPFSLFACHRLALVQLFGAGSLGATMQTLVRFRQSYQCGGKRCPGLAKPGCALRVKSFVLQIIFPNGLTVFPHSLAASQGSD